MLSVVLRLSLLFRDEDKDNYATIRVCKSEASGHAKGGATPKVNGILRES